MSSVNTQILIHTVHAHTSIEHTYPIYGNGNKYKTALTSTENIGQTKQDQALPLQTHTHTSIRHSCECKDTARFVAIARLTNSDSIMQTLFEFSLLISADAFLRCFRVCVSQLRRHKWCIEHLKPAQCTHILRHTRSRTQKKTLCTEISSE